MKKALILGMGRSGMAAARLLAGEYELGAWDVKPEAEFEPSDIAELRALGLSLFMGVEPDFSAYDLLVLSPGVSPSIEPVQRAKAAGAIISGELELAYMHCAGSFFAITGTNGKTTTTALVGEMLKAAGMACEVVGNIGLPVAERAAAADKDTIMVTELSSFQLETVSSFAPKVSACLNITPDHLDRHGNFEEYARVKTLIYKNQGPDCYYIYNADDPETAKRLPEGEKVPVAVPFSRRRELPFGAFVRDGNLVIKDGRSEIFLCRESELKIPGKHNLENALAAAAIAFFGGVPKEAVMSALKSFAGVAHRIEFIREIDGVSYVNDSKGTNPDASIKAIEATPAPILLIAGGYEKNSDFTEFIESFSGKVKELLLIGFTAERFAKRAVELGFPQEHIHFCKDMAACVDMGRKLAAPGDTVLLSPASASWDMYKRFEDRGDDFRAKVMEL